MKKIKGLDEETKDVLDDEHLMKQITASLKEIKTGKVEAFKKLKLL